MSGGFYPHGKPGYYSYTKKFLAVGHDYALESYGNTIYPGLIGNNKGAVVSKALINLQSIINAARTAELAFLTDTGIDLKDPNASNILRQMNRILNSQDTFERGMKYMKSMAASGKDIQKNEMYRDVSRYFGSYLVKTLKSHLRRFVSADIVKMSPGQIEQLINDIIGDALVETYKQVKDFVNEDRGKIRGKFGKAKTKGEEKEVRAINDMIEVIKTLQGTGAFKKYGHLFGLTLENLTEKDRRVGIKLKKSKFSGAHVDANFGGNILELITSVVAAEIGNTNISNSGLTITGMHTGQMNQMKADTMLFVGKGIINPADYMDFVNKEYDSVRMQNIDAMDRYLKKLNENLKHVIMISDKNYSITANFGGIAAQEKMDIGSAMGMLSRFGVGNAMELLNYLANCGPSMVQGDVNGEVRTELQTMIAYFLFDHLEIKVSGGRAPGPNVVNVLNVSGIYIPLSVYLEGLYNSLKNAMGNPSSFVNVSISLGGETEQPVWTAGTWGAFRKSHETESFISYRILGGITQFLSNL